MKATIHNGCDLFIETGLDRCFAVGIIHESEGAWSLWLGPLYLCIAVR